LGLSSPADWLVPDWPAPSHVRALCSARAGGVSQGAYAGLNLGDHVGDLPATVAQNRTRLAEVIAARPVFLSQVHGVQTVRLNHASAHGTVGDACITDQPGLACTIMVADCLPVLLTDRAGRQVAAAHAGWRGLAGAQGRGVLEEVVEAFRPPSLGYSRDYASELIAWLGPCIGPTAFEVGDEVREAFVHIDAAAASCFTVHGPGKWLADLPGLARQRLAACGVQQVHGNDGSTAWCTVSNPSRFFSHRRDRVSGRMAACVWLV
jgi:polyphenol oxidase